MRKHAVMSAATAALLLASLGGCSKAREAFGLTKPDSTVGRYFYDILPRPEGTVMVALGDVAGKASPAALLMALLLAMLRTLVDEELPLPVLVQRLNLQVGRHAPASRFITLFFTRTA